MLGRAKVIIKRGFPVLEWLPQYDGEKGISDLVAGITLGLTLIPQSLAYAALAGLSPEVMFCIVLYKYKCKNYYLK